MKLLNGRLLKMKQTELPWVQIARDMLGTKEIPGPKHNQKIVDMWKSGFEATNQSHRLSEAPWKSEDTPWCGGFMAHVFQKAGLSKHIPKYFPLARSWGTVGTKLQSPAYGCVVVFTRGNMGHVGLVVGKDAKNNLMVLGGNQSNAVTIAAFSRSRVLAYRWLGTQSVPLVSRYSLPLLKHTGGLSANEA